jgi:hypothetical protein
MRGREAVEKLLVKLYFMESDYGRPFSGLYLTRSKPKFAPNGLRELVATGAVGGPAKPPQDENSG